MQMQLLGEKIGHVQVPAAALDSISTIEPFLDLVLLGNHPVRVTEMRKQTARIQSALDLSMLGRGG